MTRAHLWDEPVHYGHSRHSPRRVLPPLSASSEWGDHPFPPISLAHSQLCPLLLAIATSIPLHSQKCPSTALAGVAQWTECWPVNQRVTDLIPSQGTCLGCGPGPQYEVHEGQPHTDVSLPLFLLPFPSL